jgi:hypothetical protein
MERRIESVPGSQTDSSQLAVCSRILDLIEKGFLGDDILFAHPWLDQLVAADNETAIPIGIDGAVKLNCTESPADRCFGCIYSRCDEVGEAAGFADPDEESGRSFVDNMLARLSIKR